ncbi:hypothetical protein ZEAMMB73_Zm00001d003154 [Zea mays]|uniref:Uncharacterized protein n=1 Tax=Zea mays TaxID=4577 RepID=A0A1D6E741_MAIZE|nr:hypothetical protein ZEAMMB73_Zm00001d003154 [Zea mays]
MTIAKLFLLAKGLLARA